MSDIVEEWEELAREYKTLEAAHQTYLNKLKEVTAAQNACLSHIVHQRRRLTAINASLKESISTEKLRQLKDDTIKREAQLQLLEETLPRKSGTYLRIILGNVNVAFLSQEAKFKYKDEYEKFKLICHMIAFTLMASNLFITFRPLEIVYSFYLLWYYCATIVREGVLRANGSNIKGWWRLHHALSVLASGIILIWPENSAWYGFRSQFIWYNLYNSMVHYLQFKYQSGALYRLKALGKKDNMDVTIEGFQYWMWKGLAFLFPFLFLAYFFQLYNAYVLYRLYVTDPEASWHVLAIAVLMWTFFLGNSITTLMVIPNKLKNSVLVKYKVMTRRLVDAVSEKTNIPLSKSENKTD